MLGGAIPGSVAGVWVCVHARIEGGQGERFGGFAGIRLSALHACWHMNPA